MYKIIAFLILAVFYGCYLLKLLMQKKKGIQTVQMGKDKEGFAKVIELTLKFITCIVPLTEVVSIIMGTTCLPQPARWTGMAFGVIGCAVFIVSVITMRDNWRAGVSEKDRTELVTNGIYRFSRNPAFLGFDLMYLGILLMFFNPILFIISAFGALIFHLQIVNVEEEHLLRMFGEDYLKYIKQVNRYLGRGKASCFYLTAVAALVTGECFHEYRLHPEDTALYHLGVTIGIVMLAVAGFSMITGIVLSVRARKHRT